MDHNPPLPGLSTSLPSLGQRTPPPIWRSSPRCCPRHRGSATCPSTPPPRARPRPPQRAASSPPKPGFCRRCHSHQAALMGPRLFPPHITVKHNPSFSSQEVLTPSKKSQQRALVGMPAMHREQQPCTPCVVCFSGMSVLFRWFRVAFCQ